METESSLSDLRIASFAVYLNPGDDSFVKKLVEPGQLPSPAALIQNDQQPPVTIRTAKIVPKDGEIGVFGAEKYFNMTLDSDSSAKTPRLDYARNIGFKKESHHSMDPPNYYTSSKVIRTASISSESSWTSQSTFLRSFQRNNNISQNKVSSCADQRSGFFAGLSCYRSCNDRKSIYTVPHRPNINTILEGGESRKQLLPEPEDHSRTGSKRMEQPFTFPVIAKSQMEEPRASLEVFGTNPNKSKLLGGGQNNNIVAVNLERKLSVLTWDAIPKTTQSVPTKSGGLDHEDMTSEASSDLFEIDNISGAGSLPPCSSNMYAPSEASIEWSVVTASAADFSVISDYDIHPFNLIPSSRNNNTIAAAHGNYNHKPNFTRSSNYNEREANLKGRQSGLLGCKNHKAVQVAETTGLRAMERPPKNAAA